MVNVLHLILRLNFVYLNIFESVFLFCRMEKKTLWKLAKLYKHFIKSICGEGILVGMFGYTYITAVYFVQSILERWWITFPIDILIPSTRYSPTFFLCCMCEFMGTRILNNFTEPEIVKHPFYRLCNGSTTILKLNALVVNALMIPCL